MAMTDEQAQNESQAFADAFASDEGRMPEPTEDEAFGIAPEEAPAEEEVNEADQELPAEEVVEPAADPTDTEAAESQPASEDMSETSVVLEAEGDEPTDPKDLQRQKSWEGRLKAKEAELKAREEALKGPMAAEEAAESPMAAEAPSAEAAEAVAEAVESGELTVEQAMATLGNDFGPEFTKMMGVLIKSQAQEIAAQMADERVGAVRGELDGVVKELVSDKERSHYEMISDAHPDFIEVAGSPEFKAFIDGLPGTEQQRAQQVISGGTARQINKLLSTFKTAKTAEPDSQAMDDAEGVRSTALTIPEKPRQSTSYEDAWDEF